VPDRDLSRIKLPPLTLMFFGTSIEMTYSAGFTGKDYIDLGFNAGSLSITVGDDKSASALKANISSRFTSEASTFPDLEHILILDDWFSSSTVFNAEFDTVKGKWMTSIFQGASLKLSLNSGVADFYCSESLFQNELGELSVGNGSFEITQDEDGILVKSKNPLSSVQLKAWDRSLAMQSLSGSVRILDRTLSFDTQSKLRGGGEIDLYGKITSLSPELLGTFRSELTSVPFSAIRGFYTPPLTGASFEYETLSGEVNLIAQGNSRGNGSVRIEAKEFTFKVNTSKFSQPEFSIACDFDYEKGIPQIIKGIRLDFGSAFSYSGRLEFAESGLKNMTIESARIDSEKLLNLLKPVVPSFENVTMKGSIILEGSANNFTSDWLPTSSSIRIKVVDEISLIASGKPISTEILGLTSSINISSNLVGDSLKFRIDGDLLPEQVNLNAKRLFLSSQRVNIFGDFQYIIDAKALSIAKLRFESETGLVEEISGNLRFGEGKTKLDLKFKDWGLTLEQVLALIDEVPKNMRVKGGNFILERSLSGTLDSLKSSYKLILNNLFFDSKTIKIKGLGLLIEFP